MSSRGDSSKKPISYLTNHIVRKNITHYGFYGLSGRTNDSEQYANKNSEVIIHSKKNKNCTSKESTVTTENYLVQQ